MNIEEEDFDDFEEVNVVEEPSNSPPDRDNLTNEQNELKELLEGQVKEQASNPPSMANLQASLADLISAKTASKETKKEVSSTGSLSDLINAQQNENQGSNGNLESLISGSEAINSAESLSSIMNANSDNDFSMPKPFAEYDGEEEVERKVDNTEVRALSLDDDEDDDEGDDTQDAYSRMLENSRGLVHNGGGDSEGTEESDGEDSEPEEMDYDKLLRMSDDIVEPVYNDIAPQNYALAELNDKFLELANEILQFKPSFRADDLKSPLEFGLNDFMKMNPDLSEFEEDFKYGLREHIKIDTEDYFIKLILDIQNLKKNQSTIQNKYKRDVTYIEEIIGYQIESLHRKNNRLTQAYEDSMHEKKSDSQRFTDRISDNLTLMNEALDRGVDSIINNMLKSKESEFTPHIKEAIELKKKIDAKKEELTRLNDILKSEIGEEFHSDYTEQLEQSKSENVEEIAQLIQEVKAHLESLDFKDTPYFKKYILKFFDYFFLLTARAEGEVKSLVFLLNILGFLLFLKFFSPVFIMFMLTTIAVDTLQFFKLVDRNKSTVFLVSFSDGIEERIKNIQAQAIAELRKSLQPQIDIVNEIMKDKIISLKKFTRELNDFNLNVLNSFITLDEIKEMTFKKVKRLERIINRVGSDKLETISKDSSTTLAEIPPAIDLKAEELSKAPNLDIMEKDFKEEFYWNNTYKVGRYGVTIDEAQYGVDANVILDEGSYIIEVKDIATKQLALTKLFNLIVQQYNFVKPENFKVTYIDLTDYGSDINPMLSINEDVSKVIIEESDFKEHISNTRKEMGSRFSTNLKGYSSATEYNFKNKDEPGVPRLTYELTVIYGPNEKTLSDPAIKSMARNAKKTGMPLVIFYVTDDMIRPNDRGELVQPKQHKELMETIDYKISFVNNEFEMSKVLGLENREGVIFQERENMERFKLSFDELLYMDKIKQVEGIIEDSKMSTIYYKQLLAQYATPLHQGNTLKEVELCPGYIDGDFTKPFTVGLGDNAVHAMMGGSTGSGKSNTINVIIANLIAKYSPEWLELYMLDFKIVEFKFYTKVVKVATFTRAQSRLPHASLIAGTKDPEYAESIFKKAVREMARRYKLMANGINFEGKTYSFKKIQDWNEFILDKNLRGKNGLKIIPRIVLIIDEFQAMFKMEDDEKKAYIRLVISDLGKEARAAGIHMFFTSQSMDGTVTDDIKAQFLLRFCLAASPATSASVLGNKEASTISGKGWLYMNQDSDRAVEKNVKLKVPFIPPSDLVDLMGEVEASAKNIHEESGKLVPFYLKEYYDEEKQHDYKELDIYIKSPKIIEKQDHIMIGNRVDYSDNPLPQTFELTNNDSENIFFTANSKVTIANLTNTLLSNLSTKRGGKNNLIYLNYDSTLDGMIKQEEFLHEDMINVANEVKGEFMQLLDMLISECLGIEITDFMDFDKLRPTYPIYREGVDPRTYVIITGLNKAHGFNGDLHDPKYQNKLLFLLKHGPMYGLTMILNWKEPFRGSKYLPYLAYRITGKISPDFSQDLFRNRRAKDLLTGDKGYVGLFKSTIDDTEFKFKIYNFEYDKSLLASGQLNFEIDLGEVVDA